MINWNLIPKFELVWNYKKWKIEKWFQFEIVKNLKKLWFICFHPSDIWMNNKFLDLHLIDINWNLWWIEFKKIDKDSFNFKQFEDWQIILLREFEKRNPEIARVFIYSVKHNDYKILTFNEIIKLKNEKWWIKLFS